MIKFQFPSSSPSGRYRDIEEDNQCDSGHHTGNCRMQREGATKGELSVVSRGINRHNYGGPRALLQSAATAT